MRLQPRRAVLWLLPVVGVVLALLGVFYWQATRFPQEGSRAVTFARDMRAHHAQAVDLSMHILERPVSPLVRILAQDIAMTQQAQFGQMGGWLDVWGVTFSGLEAPMAGMDRAGMGMASDADVASLATLAPARAEVRYLQLMVRHHQGGVAMARVALDSGVPQVGTLARSIVASQTAEIGVLNGMLKERGAAPAGLDAHPMTH